jgi:aminocarboxymuconate-semialdehyde decarboxylase
MTQLKIDIHTHILPEKIPNWANKFGYGGFVSLHHHKPCCAKMMIDNDFFREVQQNCWHPPTRIADCNAMQVQVQVLSTVPVMFHYWAKDTDALATSAFLNDHIASIVQQYPTRFVGLGTVPLQNTPLAIKELQRCLSIGLHGVQIGSHIGKMNLNAPELFDFFAAAEALGAAVFVHPWDMMGKNETPDYWLPWLVGMPAETSRAICSMIFGGVLERLPNLRVAFAHGGGSFPATISRIQHGYHVRPDLCAIHTTHPPKYYLGKFWIDSLVHDDRMLDYLIDIMGADRIALGSDYPFPLGEAHAGKLIESMPYSQSTKSQLLSGAALSWLNLRADRFFQK